MIAAVEPKLHVSRAMLVETICTVCALHKFELDPDMLQLAWAHKAAWEIHRSGVQGDLLISAVYVSIKRRDAELRAARWYAAN